MMKKIVTLSMGIFFVLSSVAGVAAAGNSYQKMGLAAGSSYQKRESKSYRYQQQQLQLYKKDRAQLELNKNCDGPQNKTRTMYNR